MEGRKGETPEHERASRKPNKSIFAEQASVAIHRDAAQSEDLTDHKDSDLGTDVQPENPESRSGDVSTSGRTAQDERPVTFRTLGVSEWLDK